MRSSPNAGGTGATPSGVSIRKEIVLMHGVIALIGVMMPIDAVRGIDLDLGNGEAGTRPRPLMA